jgi:predicted HTH transcriptional regulator
VGENPMTGTYRRDYEGDYCCDEPAVRRMMAEATQDSRDDQLLEGFDLNDIDLESFEDYRNEFRSTKPGHPWVALDDKELLRNLGGWTEDRQTGETGLTLAGILMFGRHRSILDALPNYILDYQERPGQEDSGPRWVDRITTDGSWSGNLYDFYRKVYPRLTSDLKVPFRLEQSRKRIDETVVHEGLREALVNTLIHADYEGRVSIQILKYPDRFRFRNPGSLRISPAQVKEGGVSDCRNRNLQKMFQLIGAGEQAGSGFPKILRAWKEQHWRKPILRESYGPDQTILQLPLVSLIPNSVLDELVDRFGEAFKFLGESKRLAVATAQIEGRVTNQRLHELTGDHPRDITNLLGELVEDDFLESRGTGKGTYYVLPGQEEPSEGEFSLFETWNPTDSSRSDQPARTEEKQATENSERRPSRKEEHEETWEQLLKIAEPVRETGKAPREQVKSKILELCRGRYLKVRQLVDLLGRSKDTLRNHYLNKLVKEDKLKLHYPDKLTHEDQAYKTDLDD